jgi:hypothetical protein
MKKSNYGTKLSKRDGSDYGARSSFLNLHGQLSMPTIWNIPIPSGSTSGYIQSSPIYVGSTTTGSYTIAGTNEALSNLTTFFNTPTI